MNTNFQYIKKENYFSFSSPNPGPTTCILAGVHGNESDGVNAIKEISEIITLDRGKVIFLIANQKAVKKNIRFVEENLNRCFLQDYTSSSYEYNLAQELKTVLDRCDICLDLHNSTSEKSEPFIICETNAQKYLDVINTNKVVFGFDTFEPGGTDYYMNLKGKIGICVECGSKDENGTEFAKKLIYNFLKKTGNIIGEYSTYEQKEYYQLIENFVPEGPFTIVKAYADFELIGEKTTIGYDNDKPIISKKKAYLLFGRNILEKNTKNEEAFLLAKKHNPSP